MLLVLLSLRGQVRRSLGRSGDDGDEDHRCNLWRYSSLLQTKEHLARCCWKRLLFLLGRLDPEPEVENRLEITFGLDELRRKIIFRAYRWPMGPSQMVDSRAMRRDFALTSRSCPIRGRSPASIARNALGDAAGDTAGPGRNRPHSGRHSDPHWVAEAMRLVWPDRRPSVVAVSSDLSHFLDRCPR
jgi:hypothetical protein